MAEVKIVWAEEALKDIEKIIYRNYRIVYLIEERAVEIITVFHGSKLLE